MKKNIFLNIRYNFVPHNFGFSLEIHPMDNQHEVTEGQSLSHPKSINIFHADNIRVL